MVEMVEVQHLLYIYCADKGETKSLFVLTLY